MKRRIRSQRAHGLGFSFRGLSARRSGLCAPALALLMLAAPASAYIYDPSDFATQVVGYVQGTGVGNDFISGLPYNNPLNALGRPTVDTTGDGFTIDVNAHVPVVPVYGAWRDGELVTIGQGGSLTLKFDRPVYNNSHNPYGLDFIIFGNSPIYVNGTDSWDNGDPNAMRGGSVFAPEVGIVSVSQDGHTWYTFGSGPYADSFAPTLGRVYDPAHPDASVGAFNQWWGQPTDPTLPLDPALTINDLVGKTVAEMAQLYGQSAGGTAFDIGALGLDWIQYLRIDNPDGSAVTPDIDAVAIVSPLPEPGTIGLLALCALAMLKRNRRT